MKIIFPLALIMFFWGAILLVSPFLVFAQVPQAPGVTNPAPGSGAPGAPGTLPGSSPGGGGARQQTIDIPNPIKAESIPDLINQIVDWLLAMGLIISTGIIIWSAYLFLFAGASPDRQTRARNTLKYAVIGIIILLLAKGVTQIIASFFNP